MHLVEVFAICPVFFCTFASSWRAIDEGTKVITVLVFGSGSIIITGSITGAQLLFAHAFVVRFMAASLTKAGQRMGLEEETALRRRLEMRDGKGGSGGGSGGGSPHELGSSPTSSPTST